MDFAKFKTMQFPREVYVGHGVLHNIKSVVSANSRNERVAIITGHTTYGIAGKETSEILSDSKFDVSTYKTGSSSDENLSSVLEFVKESRAGIVVGVGGGSKIDLAKMVGHMVGIPMISVPTTPSHDGIASPRATIKKTDMVLSEQAIMPVAIIADTSVMVKAPYRYLAAGAADVISNVTAVLDWKLASRIKGEEFSSSAATLSDYASRELVEKAHMIQEGVEEAVWLVVKQILASGTAMAIASSSRPASGSEHLFAHALEKNGHGTSIHGEQCAMGSLVSMYMHGGNWKLLSDTYSKLNLSTLASDYGISDQVAIESLKVAHAIRPERFTILGNTDLSEGAARKALEITGVI